MSTPPRYPRGTVRALLETDRVTLKTREVLQARLAEAPVTSPAFFTAEAFATLKAACARLIPQTGPESVDVAGVMDTRLAKGKRNGWRFDALPPDGEAYRRGLTGLDETARAIGKGAFAELPPSDQDRVLTAVERGDPPGETWRTLPAFYWFEELLVEATEIFYAHPFGQEEIGFVGMADAGGGWTRIRLNEREAREPEPDAQV